MLLEETELIALTHLRPSSLLYVQDITEKEIIKLKL